MNKITICFSLKSQFICRGSETYSYTERYSLCDFMFWLPPANVGDILSVMMRTVASNRFVHWDRDLLFHLCHIKWHIIPHQKKCSEGTVRCCSPWHRQGSRHSSVPSKRIFFNVSKSQPPIRGVLFILRHFAPLELFKKQIKEKNKRTVGMRHHLLSRHVCATGILWLLRNLQRSHTEKAVVTACPCLNVGICKLFHCPTRQKKPRIISNNAKPCWVDFNVLSTNATMTTGSSNISGLLHF